MSAQGVLDLDAPTAPYQPHSATSRTAAESIAARLGEKQLAVLRHFAAHPEGLCDEELIGYCVGIGWSPNGIRPRRVELVERGYVADSGRKVVGSSGRLAVVWTVTGAGLARLRDGQP